MTQLENALYALRNFANLTPAEIVNVTLGDVHLSGASPYVMVWEEHTGQRKTVPLNEHARDALVAWLLARPDRPTALVFPGDEDEGVTAAEVEALLSGFTPPPSWVEIDQTGVSAHVIEEENLPFVGPPAAGQAPPPFRTTPPPRSPERIAIAAPQPEASASPAEPEPEPPASATPSPRPPVAVQGRQIPRWGVALVGGLAVLTCVGLVTGGIFLFSGRGDRQLPKATIAAENPQPGAKVPTATETSIPTPTDTPLLPPTETPTLAATNEPLLSPTPTSTPLPTLTSTPTPLPTAIPSLTPTRTPVPTATNTPVPLVPAQPSPTPTIGFKYAAPKLLSPEPDFRFIAGNTIELTWEPVGELAGNEQYAVRLVYKHNTETVYRGGNVKETRWTVPIELFHDADGPEFDHVWYVYVEAVQPDGKGIPISPESEHRHFTWK